MGMLDGPMNSSFQLFAVAGSCSRLNLRIRRIAADLRPFMGIDVDRRLVHFANAWNQWQRYISMKSCNEHGAVGFSLDELLARLFQYALLEIGPLAEELLVRGSDRMLAYLIAVSSMVQM